MREEMKLRLICPLTVLTEDEDGGECGFPYDVLKYQDNILQQIEREKMPEEQERGLMTYYHEEDGVNRKVRWCYPTLAVVDGTLYGAVDCRLTEQLTGIEMVAFKDYLEGQLSDGWGEGFEQRPIKTPEGNLYISFYFPDGDWYLREENALVNQMQTDENAQVTIKFARPAYTDTKMPVVTAYLPADAQTLRALCLDAGLNSPQDRIEVYDCKIKGMSVLDNRVDLASLAEAQALAERVGQLDEYEREELREYGKQLLCDAQFIDGERFINAAYWNEVMMRVPGIGTPFDLGKYLFKENLVPELENLPESAENLLDFSAIGRKQLQDFGGVFTRYGYSFVMEPEAERPHPYVRKVIEPSELDEEFTLPVQLTKRQIAALAIQLPWNSDNADLSAAVNALQTALPNLPQLMQKYADEQQAPASEQNDQEPPAPEPSL